MLSRTCFAVCQSLGSSTARFRLPRISQSFRKFSLDVVRWSRFNKPNVYQQAENIGAAYMKDAIPVRPASDLLKALGFTVAGGCALYYVAALSEYEWMRKRKSNIFPNWTTFDDFWSGKRSMKGSMSWIPDELRNISAGQIYATKFALVCGLVTLAWRIRPAEALMWRYFSNSFASKSLCLPMLLSVFSHKYLFHLGINMYVMSSFAPIAILNFLGVDQFNAMFLTGGLVSSLTSLIHKRAVRSPIRALGASGAICTALVYTCMKVPEARLNVVFLPVFTFSAENAVYGIIIFDLLGLIFKFRLFDHAAHLGGSLFGLFYAKYGEEWYCKRVRPVLFRHFKQASPK